MLAVIKLYLKMSIFLENIKFKCQNIEIITINGENLGTRPIFYGAYILYHTIWFFSSSQWFGFGDCNCSVLHEGDVVKIEEVGL